VTPGAPVETDPGDEPPPPHPETNPAVKINPDSKAARAQMFRLII
jgi:hypothetical protein